MSAEGGSDRLTPYARAMGMREDRIENGMPVLAMDFDGIAQGRPGALHGGAIAGLLETAAYAGLAHHLDELGRSARLKPINVTVQFLSSGKERASYAQARIVRLGRRNANISVEAWQDDRSKPIASAILNILMVDSSA